MKALALALASAALPCSALAAPSDSIHGYECRYDGVDAEGRHLIELGHILTSDIDGKFETRTLGIPLWAAPSAQVYAWHQGPEIGKQLYVELYDNQDQSRRDGKLVPADTPEVSVALSANGVDAVLTCKSF